MYFVLKEKDDETNVYLDLETPSSIPEQYQLRKGVSRLNGWPEDVFFEFSRDNPEGMILTDWVENSPCWLIISDRFKAVLEKFREENIEYLPIKIKNHKGRLVSERYWIVNFLVLIEAVDREHSVFKVDGGNVGGIRMFDKLVLREDILKSGPVIFRLKEQPMIVLSRQNLVERLNEEGITGMRFVETDKFRTFPV